jgi:hypothetical protein
VRRTARPACLSIPKRVTEEVSLVRGCRLVVIVAFFVTAWSVGLVSVAQAQTAASAPKPANTAPPRPAATGSGGSPALTVAPMNGSEIHLDGILDDDAWGQAEAIEDLTMLEPVQGGTPTGRTRVRVLASPTAIVFGVECDDPDPKGIVSYTKQRDGAMGSEDHIEIVLGPFLDGRSGYVFWVNPNGARYDALIDPTNGEPNSNWDGIWEAAARRTTRGWAAEIRIPIQTLSFTKGLTSWEFNIQRRIQRLQETERWASPQLDFKVTQVSRAGRLTALPPFELGLGLSVRPAGIVGGSGAAHDVAAENDSHASLDVTQRLGPNLLASGSVNTDFAETEVDARQTNLTRFSLFFPEKRTFFLEGADIFQFGPGLGS